MLDPAELSRRIKAARELRGLSQVQLGDLFDGDRLNKSDPGRIERMDPEVSVRRPHLDAFARHLRVPPRWFTAETVDEIVGYRDTDAPDLAEMVKALIDPPEESSTDPDATTAPSPDEGLRRLARALVEAAREIQQSPASQPQESDAPDRLRPASEGDAG